MVLLTSHQHIQYGLANLTPTHTIWSC